ncbi:MAG: DUF5626 family protein [Erysipelotrichaceae bacterium]|nr:DUF5626 family protein [Erysipelotrichaceae bacterium]
MKKTIIIISILMNLMLPVNVYSECSVNNSENEIPILICKEDEQCRTITFYDNEGLLTELSIRSIENARSERQISISNARLSMSFNISISNGYITNAYNGQYSTSYWTVTGEYLAVDSSSQATYTLDCRRFLISTQKYLRANIVNGEIQVSYN